MLDQLFVLNPWIAYGLSAAIVLAAAQIGHRTGVIWRRGHPEAVAADILTLEGAALGLLALMIGFTFSMALGRHDARLSGVVEEANSIGTTALRARMLPEPHTTEVNGLLAEYVELRVKGSHRRQSQPELEKTINRSNQLQAQLWQHAIAASAADPRSIPAGLFVQTLNEMIDMQEKRLAAARDRVPDIVFILLYAIAAIAIGFSGYVCGLGTSGGRVPVAIMAVLVASVIAMIGDLDRSQSGFITVGQRAMQNLKDSIQR